MSVAGMIDDGDVGHDGFQSFDYNGEPFQWFPQTSCFHKVTGNIWDAGYIFSSRYQIVTKGFSMSISPRHRAQAKESVSCPMEFFLRC